MSRRIPWIAAIMSAVLPGFGQLYNGQINRGIWFFLTFATLVGPMATLAILYLPSQLMLPLSAIFWMIGICAWVLSIFDAFIQARKQQNYTVKSWQTMGLYTLILVLFSTVLLPLMVVYIRQHQVQPFYIPSNSMNPTLQQGDTIFADMRYNCPFCQVHVTKGDVVIFVYPNNRTQYYIKRIVGMPGDVIEETGETVPNGHVYVMGDNRDRSNDSRVFGAVPLIDVVGKAQQIWFSKSSEGIEWDRIGKFIE